MMDWDCLHGGTKADTSELLRAHDHIEIYLGRIYFHTTPSSIPLFIQLSMFIHNVQQVFVHLNHFVSVKHFI